MVIVEIAVVSGGTGEEFARREIVGAANPPGVRAELKLHTVWIFPPHLFRVDTEEGRFSEDELFHAEQRHPVAKENS